MMKRIVWIIGILAATTLMATPAMADGYRRAARHNHARHHDDLDHRAFHRELEHREAHRYPMSYWQHERLHDHLDHEAFHDHLEHRSAHRSGAYYPRYVPYGYGYGYGYHSHSGFGISGRGFSIWFGR